MIARQSTARTIIVGPVLDSTGAAKTDEVVGSIKITKNGTVGNANGSATLTHDHAGKYRLGLTAADTDTVGILEISLNSGTNDMPVKGLNIVETAVWDALFADGATGYATAGDVSPTINFSPTIEPTELSAGSVSAIQSGLALESSVQSVITTLSEGVELDSSALDPVLEAIDEINAGGLTAEQAAQLNAIEAAVTEVPVTVNNFGQFDNSGALLLKRGHTATIVFTSTTNNLVPDMSSATTKVFFGIYDTARRRWLQLEGTKVVNTGLQSISFTIPADKAAAMITGVHLFDAVVVYGYTAASGDTPASYTSLRPFASGNVRVVELSLDLTDL